MVNRPIEAGRRQHDRLVAKIAIRRGILLPEQRRRTDTLHHPELSPSSDIERGCTDGAGTVPAVGATDQSAARRTSGRAGGRVAFVAVGVALLALGAFSASRAAPSDASPDLPGNPGGGDAILNDALLVAGGALAAALLIYVAPILRQGRGPKRVADDEVPRAALWLRLLAGAAVILTVVAAILILSRGRQEPNPPVEAPPPTTVEEQGEPTEGAGAQGWAALGLASAGAVAVIIGVVWWKRRGRHGGGAIDDFDFVRTEATESFDFDALDPVDAIRAAYAAARHAISSLGVAARAPETPYEYLERVRSGAPAVQRPVATLTRLFEVARFSHHPVTPAMKADAIAAHAAVMSEVARARDAMVPS